MNTGQLLVLFWSTIPDWFWTYNKVEDVAIHLPYQVWLNCKKLAEVVDPVESRLSLNENGGVDFFDVPIGFGYRPEITIFNPVHSITSKTAVYTMELETIQINLN